MWARAPSTDTTAMIRTKPAHHRRIPVSIVRDIFRIKIHGMSALNIAETLNSRGMLSPMAYKRDRRWRRPAAGQEHYSGILCADISRKRSSVQRQNIHNGRFVGRMAPDGFSRLPSPVGG